MISSPRPKKRANNKKQPLIYRHRVIYLSLTRRKVGTNDVTKRGYVVRAGNEAGWYHQFLIPSVLNIALRYSIKISPGISVELSSCM